MTEKEKAILTVFGKIVPDLSDIEKEKLLAFGEGMAFKAQRQSSKEPETHPANT